MTGLLASVFGVLFAASSATIGSLTDSDEVVTSVDGIRPEAIEATGLPGPAPGVAVTRTVGADLSVTDTPNPPFTVDVIPIVETNYVTETVPVTSEVSVSRYPASSAVVTMDGVDLPYTYTPTSRSLGRAQYSTYTYDVANGHVCSVEFTFDETYRPSVRPSRGSATVKYVSDSQYGTTGSWYYDGSYQSDPDGEIGPRFLNVHENRDGVLDLSDIPDLYGEFHDIQMRFTTEDDATPPSIYSSVRLVTNGWITVTNSFDVVTNGFLYVTNDFPVVRTEVMTRRSMTDAFRSVAGGSAGDVEDAITGAVMRVVRDNVGGLDVSPNVDTGTEKLVLTNADVGPIETAVVDGSALNPRVALHGVSSISLPDDQSIMFGGRVVDGRVVGGRTLYARIEEAAAKASRDAISVSTDDGNRGPRIATLTTVDGPHDVRIPEFSEKSGGPMKYVDSHLRVKTADETRFGWDVYSSCSGSDLQYVGSVTTAYVSVSSDGKATVGWDLDLSTLRPAPVYPTPHPVGSGSSAAWESPTDGSFFGPSTNRFTVWTYELDAGGFVTLFGWRAATDDFSDYMSYPASRIGLFVDQDRAADRFEIDFPSVSGRMVFQRTRPSSSYTDRGAVLSGSDLLDPSLAPVPQITNPADPRKFVRHDNTVGSVTYSTVTNAYAWKVDYTYASASTGLPVTETFYLGPFEAEGLPEGDFDGLISWKAGPGGLLNGNQNRTYIRYAPDRGGGVVELLTADYTGSSSFYDPILRSYYSAETGGTASFSDVYWRYSSVSYGTATAVATKIPLSEVPGSIDQSEPIVKIIEIPAVDSNVTAGRLAEELSGYVPVRDKDVVKDRITGSAWTNVVVNGRFYAIGSAESGD